MKKFPLDLSKFKKIHADDKATTLQHTDGHQIKIAHSALTPKLKERLHNLETVQHFKDGGGVEPITVQDYDPSKYVGTGDVAVQAAKLRDEQEAQQAKAAQKNRYEQSLASLPKTLEEAQAEPPVQTQLAPARMPIYQPERQPAAAPIDLSAPLAAQTRALGESKAGEQAIAKALGAGAEAEAKRLEEFGAQQQKETEAYQKRMDELAQDRMRLKSDIDQGHVDPRRFINSMSTGDKILTGIGLLLGGMGAGLTHGPNLAAQFLDNSINQDIDAQKAELGKKNTLLSHNLQETNDLKQAMQLTRMQMNDMLSAQLKMEAARAQSAQTAGMLQTIAGKYDLQNAQLQHQIALQHAAMSGVQGPDPAKLVPLLVPKEHQTKAFGEIEAAENTKKMSKSILDSFERAAEENTILQTGAGLVRTPASVYALHQAMQPTFKDLEGTVRQAAMDNTFKNITPAPGDTDHTIQLKREALQEYLQSKLSAPTARAYGIDLSRFATTQPQAPRDMREGKPGSIPGIGRVVIRNGKVYKVNE